MKKVPRKMTDLLHDGGPPCARGVWKVRIAGAEQVPARQGVSLVLHGGKIGVLGPGI